MTHDRQTLWMRLRAVRRRLLWIGGGAGAIWALAGAAALLLVAAWLDLVWELSPQARVAALVLAGALGTAVLAIVLGKTFGLGRPAVIARRLDAAAGSGGEILTGVELDIAALTPGPSPVRRERGVLLRQKVPATLSPFTLSALSAGLAHLAVAHAAAVALGVPAARALPARAVGRSLAALGGLAVLVALVAVGMPRLAWTQWNRFWNPFGDVPPYSSTQFSVEPGDVEVVYGEPLDVRVTTSGSPVDRVELVIAGGAAVEETLPMFPEPDGRWRAALASVTEPAEYHVRAHRARSTRYRIGVITVPRIEAVRLRIAPPPYTRLPAYEGPLPQGGIAGLRGTQVEIRAESNRPLSGGRIALTVPSAASIIAMDPIAPGGREVVGRFEVVRDGKFQLRVIDVDGQESREAFSGAITLLGDQRPFIRILQPEPMALATPSAALPVVLSAEDDYGISRVQLYRSLNDSRALPMDARLPPQLPRRAQETVYLALADYGLSPGDAIRLFGRVEDNDPAGTKGAESSTVTVRIISQEEFERLLRAQKGLEVLLSKYRQAQRRMEALAKEIESIEEKLKGLPPDGPIAENLRKELKRLAGRMREESQAIREAARHVLPYDVDAHLGDQLQQLAAAIQQGAEGLEGLSKEPGATNAAMGKSLAELANKLSAGRGQFDEQAIRPLEHLASVFPLLADAQQFVDLAQRQRDLAERMASLRGRDGQDDPALKTRMRDLEDEQRQLDRQLSELLADIEDHAKQLPDDPRLRKLRRTAAKFVQDVRASGAAEAMADAEAALADFAGTRAHEKAKLAAEILARFVKQCEGDGEGDGIPQAGRECLLVFQPTLNKCLAGTAAQLLAEMGLGTGPGGAGGGYGMAGTSARRGGNVGLYGSLPGMGATYESGSGRSGRDVRAAGLGRGGTSAAAAAAEVDVPGSSPTGGAGDASVPPQYRRRVGQYFGRLAEESVYP